MKKLAENKKTIFYKSEFSDTVKEKYKGKYKLVIAKDKKNGDKEFLLIKNDKPIYANQRVESVFYHIDVLEILDKR